jgi:hypothetical protein
VIARVLLSTALLVALGPAEDGPGEDDTDAPADDAPAWDQPVEIEPPPERELGATEDEPQADEPVGDPAAEPAVGGFGEADYDDVDREPTQFVDQPTAPEGPSRTRRKPKRMPPIYGPLLLTGGIGAGPRSVGLGLGATYFVIPWIGLGAAADDTVVFDSPAFNDFALTGHVWVLFAPYARLTPYVRPGLGGEFFSGGLGAYGLWKAGAGLIMRLGRAQRLALRLGAEVIGRFPDDRFARNFTCALIDKPCSFGVRPEIGINFRFGKR